MRGFETRHVPRGITGPGLAADILIEPAIAVGEDVETCDLLIFQITRQRIDILFTKFVVRHGVDERTRTQVLRIPARTRQGTDDRCR